MSRKRSIPDSKSAGRSSIVPYRRGEDFRTRHWRRLATSLEQEAEEIFARIRALGPDGTMMSGILHGIETGWFSAEIAEAAFAYQQKLEKGDKKVVGVNCYPGTVGQPVEILRVSHQVERDQAAELARRRAERDGAAVDRALAGVVAAARSSGNMIPPILAAARAEATLGEICGVLRDEWGIYSETPVF